MFGSFGFGPPELPPGPPPEPEPAPEALPDPEPLSSSELKVLHWRVTEFERMGFSVLHSGMLAALRHIDLHKVERMLAGGCSHDTALKILT